MLEARDITFGYAKGAPIYEGFSLAVEPGERVALRAPSGFGKTTLCRLLAGYEEPQAGDVLCDGAPLPRKGVCPVQLIGQHPELAVDPRLRMERTLAEAGKVDDALLDALGIRREWLRRFPHELSGGELQRFCIARAVATRPRYLVADEISTMLDALTQAQIWRFLLDWQRESGAGGSSVGGSGASEPGTGESGTGGSDEGEPGAGGSGAGIVFVTHSPALAARLATRVLDLPSRT